MTPVPIPIQLFIEATNRQDQAGFLAAFSKDATLVDWGRQFVGLDRIADWNRTDNIGVQSHLDILDIEQNGQSYRATVRVRGQGFNGTGTMTFQLLGNFIHRLDIT